MKEGLRNLRRLGAVISFSCQDNPAKQRTAVTDTDGSYWRYGFSQGLTNLKNAAFGW